VCYWSHGLFFIYVSILFKVVLKIHFISFYADLSLISEGFTWSEALTGKLHHHPSLPGSSGFALILLKAAGQDLQS